MKRNLVARFTILMLVGTACSQSREGTATDDAASKIAQSREKAGELANSAQNDQPVRFVSDIERIDRPVTKPKPADVVRPGKDPVEVEPVVTTTEVPEIAPPEIAVDSSTIVVSAPRSMPSVIPRDAPQPEAVGGGTGSGTRRGRDPGPDIGTVIGVVIRGGVGVDHCAKHPRGPTAIPNGIPNRFPSRIRNRLPTRVPSPIPNQFPQFPNR